MYRLAALLAAGLAVAGCGGGSSPAREAATATTVRPAETTTATAAPPETTSFLVYLARGEHVGAARRIVERTEAVGAEAIRALLAGPTSEERAAGLRSEIPAGVLFNGLAIEDGVATVDLGRSFESGGGSLSMGVRVAQVVYTLTQFPSVERVRFLLDGEPVDAIGGEGVIVEPPVGRAGFEAQTPPILVESPAVGDAVTSPLTVRGTASVFEANVQLELRGADGEVLAETFATATEGAPGRGSFEAMLPFDAAPGDATVVAFTRSAADNSVQDAVEIPVTLAG